MDDSPPDASGILSSAIVASRRMPDASSADEGVGTRIVRDIVRPFAGHADDATRFPFFIIFLISYLYIPHISHSIFHAFLSYLSSILFSPHTNLSFTKKMRPDDDWSTLEGLIRLRSLGCGRVLGRNGARA